ncbi:MAG TPA: N-acetyl-gamma-glutamyl-phosphate reductase [Atribacterota bacterium]|nr:N-acetyl-gamma-glutamyl-phosphate reductase [Atribacterota bacterium]
MEKIKVSIIGATGYSGKELIRILLKHPRIKLMHLVSASYVGQNICEVYPEFTNQLDKKLIELDIEKIVRDSDVVFTALPHNISLDIVPELLINKNQMKVIDLSADFRLKDSDNYTKWYKKEHSEKSRVFLKEAVYGLPELYKEDIKKATLVANPGCYPTSAILGMAPLLARRLVEADNIIIDAKSGTSGAGRKLSLGLHFSECNESFKAYKTTMHNHIPEIEQELSLLYNPDSGKDEGEKNKYGKKNKEIIVSFTPHLLPLSRGILSTCYLNLIEDCNEQDIVTLYQNFYQDAPFVRIFEPPNLPEIRFAQLTNYCDIGFTIDKRVGKIKVISVIDNLTKGASGQAVQNMNIMFNLPETMGLL